MNKSHHHAISPISKLSSAHSFAMATAAGFKGCFGLPRKARLAYLTSMGVSGFSIGKAGALQAYDTACCAVELADLCPLATLCRAIELIGRDNGCFNRTAPEVQDCVQSALSKLRLAHPASKLIAVEIELAALSPEKLGEVCTGEQGGEQYVSASADEVLNSALEAL